MPSRRAMLSMPAAFAANPGFRLIAHRGGVVDAGKAENSRASLEAAVAEGYWMVEIDVRRSRDGEPVLHHDPTLERYYGDSRRVEDLAWQELSRLRSRLDGRPPLHFDEACEICAGRMRLMLDLKGQGWPADFYRRLLRGIQSAKIPGPLYSLGGPIVRPLFEDQILVSLNARELAERAGNGEPVADRYFLFLLASDMSEADIALARRNQVNPVAAINTFRYTMARRDEETGPAEDAARLKALGVECYQIDSRYARLFR